MRLITLWWISRDPGEGDRPAPLVGIFTRSLWSGGTSSMQKQTWYFEGVQIAFMEQNQFTIPQSCEFTGRGRRELRAPLEPSYFPSLNTSFTRIGLPARNSNISSTESLVSTGPILSGRPKSIRLQSRPSGEGGFDETL